ncbi:hypothetical protein [Glutamicibacter protophormiae]|nr:hypothetical protein [Glutamicibacter protophormiae]
MNPTEAGRSAPHEASACTPGVIHVQMEFKNSSTLLKKFIC